MEFMFKQNVKLVVPFEAGERVLIQGFSSKVDGYHNIVAFKENYGGCESGIMVKISGYDSWIDIGWIQKTESQTIRHSQGHISIDSKDQKSVESQSIKELPPTDDPLLKIKKAFSDYVRSEGCSCCQDKAKHDDAAERLGELLGFEKYKDGFGYDFFSITKEEK